MDNDFWGSPRSNRHRKPDSDPSIRAALRGLVRVPDGVPAPLWYFALWLGVVALCVALGGALGAILGAWNWFR